MSNVNTNSEPVSDSENNQLLNSSPPGDAASTAVLNSSPPGDAAATAVLDSNPPGYGLPRVDLRDIAREDLSSSSLAFFGQMNNSILWGKILSVIPENFPCYVPNICAAIARRHEVPHSDDLEFGVKGILLAESQRNDSLIRKGEKSSFLVTADKEQWLSAHPGYIPEFVNLRDQDKSQAKDAPPTSPNHEIILEGPLAGIGPKNFAIPPGMSLRRAQFLANTLTDTCDPETKNSCMEAFLQFPKSKCQYFAHGMWLIVLYNDVFAMYIFEIFRKLGDKSTTWANVVLETIFCLEQQHEKAPFNFIVDGTIAVPSNLSISRIAGFLFLLNHMNEDSRNWDAIMEWFQSATDCFKNVFLCILRELGVNNDHLQNDIRRIVRRLLRYKPWGETYYGR